MAWRNRGLMARDDRVAEVLAEVTIVLERGIQSIAAAHAVMLEGCAYNAFDVGEPVEKLRSWVEVSQPPVMISSVPVLQRLGLTDVAATLGEYPKMVLDVDQALKKADGKSLPARPAHNPADLDRPGGCWFLACWPSMACWACSFVTNFCDKLSKADRSLCFR